jgi:hypothetical protein
MATIMVHPTAGGIRADIGDGYKALGISDPGGTTSIFVGTRAVVDALTAALAEIRADMDQDARDQVPSEMADWPPGELAEVFGK